MKTRYTLLAVVLLLVGVASVLPQRKAGVAKITKPAEAERRVPPYQLYLTIDEDGNLSVSIVSPTRSPGELSPADLIALIGDLPAGGDKSGVPNNVFPNVVVEPSPKIAMIDFWNPISLFPSDRTQFSIVLPDDTRLTIPRSVEKDPIEVKPNPLLLFVDIDDAGKLTLNNEPAGTLTDPKPLTDFLVRIFKDREKNGVTAEGTNETATGVTIVMPMGPRKFSDLITIANAVKAGGSSSISLSMEKDAPSRLELEVTPYTPIPVPAPKTKKKP